MFKKLAATICLFIAALGLHAQIYDPVSWDVKANTLTDNRLEIIINARVESPWHITSATVYIIGIWSGTFRSITSSEDRTDQSRRQKA